MKSKIIIPLILLLLSAAIIFLLVFPRGFTLEKIYGLSVSAVLWIAGFCLLKWSEKRNPKILLIAVLGGMLSRIAIVILAIFLVQKFTAFKVTTFVISLLIFYLACEFALVVNYALKR